MGRRAWTFCWHNVAGTWCFPGVDGRWRLERQLEWLARMTHVLPLDEVVRRLVDGEPLPPRTTAITFDDGYADNLALAVPILERLGLPATFFLVPGLLSRRAVPWWEVVSQAVAVTERPRVEWEGHAWPLRNPGERRVTAEALRRRLKQRNRASRQESLCELLEQLDPRGVEDVADLFLDWAGARELVRRGFTVGSHSWHHSILAQETAEEQQRDLLAARSDLREHLQVPADLLAYPNGGCQDYDSRTLAAARVADHAAAVTTVPGASTAMTPPLELRRFVVSPSRGIVEFAKVAKYVGAGGRPLLPA